MQLYKYSNEIERQKLKSLLEQENIPFEDRCFEDWGYNGIFRPQMGMGEIIVSEYAYEKARLVIKDFLEEERKEASETDAESEKFFLEHKARKIRALLQGDYLLLVVLGVFLIFTRGAVLFIGTAIYIVIAFFITRRIKNSRERLKVLEKDLSKFHDVS